MPKGPELPRMAVQHDTMVALSDQIAFQVIYWVGQGKLRPGQRLWSLRHLSADLGINHNTILVAFAELQQLGLVESHGARGYFVAPRHRWNRERVDAVQHAMQVAPNILKQLEAHHIPVTQGVQALILLGQPSRFGWSADADLSVVFTECNAASLTYFGDQLDAAIPLRAHRRLLADVAREPGVPDLVVTNIYHLGQLREYYDPGKFELVGLSVRVSHDTRRALEQVPRQARIAVVAPARAAMANMASIAATAMAPGREILPLNLEDLEALHAGLADADVIVIHDGNRSVLGAVNSGQRIVSYATEYDPLSLGYLCEMIEKLRRPLGVV